MKKLLFILLISLVNCKKLPTPNSVNQKLGPNYYIQIDGKEYSHDEMQKYDNEKVTIVNVYYGKHATSLYGEKAKDGAIIVESRDYCRNRYQTYFKEKSPDYSELLSKVEDAKGIVYILNDKVLSGNFEGTLASINDNVFKKIMVLSKDDLKLKYNIMDRDFGVAVEFNVPKNLYNGKKKF
jgi:hypothetical protein